MNFIIPNVIPVLPEIFLLTMACVVLLADLFTKQISRGATYMLAQAGLVITACITLATYSSVDVIALNGMFIRDSMSDVLKIGIYISTFVVFLYAKSYLIARDLFKGEFYVLGLFAVLGMMILSSAQNFLTIYLGLELLSLSLYAMVAMQRDSTNASEAAMKYFVLGAIASGMLLYGISMIYGATGSLDLATVSKISALKKDDIILVFGLVFLIIGIAFKLGVAPFHMWVPDVYHGAPTSVTVFIATAPKLAAFAMLMRILVDGLGALHVQWQSMLIILIILSMGIGNIIAIAQANIKRMLAYSAISHVGFLLLGIITGTASGYAASMFYALVYVLMSLGGFGMIILLSRKGFEADGIDDFKGLNERSPWYAFIMLILMFSMAGVPPFLGFWAKWSVLREVVSVDMVWLAAVSVAFSIVGAFYYLRIVKVMYFDKSIDMAPIECEKDIALVLSANSLVVLAIGIAPNQLMMLCRSIFAV